jgi:hypothetical protein
MIILKIIILKLIEFFLYYIFIMNCYKSSNNKFFNSASRMSDGRNFTDYRPNHEINRHIISNNKISNTHNYRMFLSRHAEEIIKRNKDYIFLKNGLFNCKDPYKTGTMLPEKTRVVCDEHKCDRILVDENGVGEGREYVTTGSNKILDPLTKVEVDVNNICTNTKDNLDYYPINKELYKPNELRPAIPGGGALLQGGDPNVLY